MWAQGGSRDAMMAVVTSFLCFFWVAIWQQALAKKWLASATTRRILHVTSCPLFMLLWPAFENGGNSRYYAAVPPVLLGFRLILAGLGNKSDSIGRTVSRTGKPQEAFKGPLIYVCCMLACIMLLWRDAPGPVTMIQMSFGDGMASCIGNACRGPVWPQKPEKRISGTIGFFVFAFIGSLLYGTYFHVAGASDVNVADIWMTLAGISVVCALVEVTPLPVDDNLSVPLVAGILSKALL